MSKRRSQQREGLHNRAQGNTVQDDNYGTGSDNATPDDLKQIVSIPKLQEQIEYMSRNAVIFESTEVSIDLPYKASPAGLELRNDLPVDAFEQIGHALLRMSDRISLFIGDWLVALDKRKDLEYGDMSSLAESYNLEPATLHNWKSLCESVKISLRSEVLNSYPDHKLRKSHYELVRTLDEPEQRKWLKKAAKEQWSVKKMRESLKKPSPSKKKVYQSVWFKQASTYLDASQHERLKKKAEGGDEKALETLRQQIDYASEYVSTMKREIEKIEANLED